MRVCPNYNNPFKELNYWIFMGLSLKRKDKEIRPYVLRPDCAFHGFSGMSDVMMDSGGNQCALKTDSYSPCQMEMRGNKPYWSECPFNTEENRKYIEENPEKVKVFPRELRPPKAKSWDGISLKDWMRHIEDIAVKERSLKQIE